MKTNANCLLVSMIFLMLPTVVMASDQDRVANLCKQKIGDLYGVDRFERVRAEKAGHHRWLVQGRVKYRHNKYPFECQIKEGRVRSWTYDGASPRHAADRDDNKEALGVALAVGAGIALAAALNDDHSHSDDDSDAGRMEVGKTIMEDNCLERLRYRIRDEQNRTARVSLESARVRGHDLVGDARVVYQGHHPHDASYTCHFDRRGHVLDTDYQLF